MTSKETLPNALPGTPASEPMWGLLIHLGYNFWCDTMPTYWANHPTPEMLKNRGSADHLRFDEATWRRVSAKLPECGINTVVIDLGEGLVYPSHPELAVRGSWTAERLERELARLRGMGIEPIPKLNFSTSHDTWLGQYGRMVSTPTYYRVVQDLIGDVIDIFGRPRLFHLGYDEENAANQSQYLLTVVRQGELWWHDFLYIAGLVEKRGVRPWMWSDKLWHDPEGFLKRMPRDILQSNWYYEGEFDLRKEWPTKVRVEAFQKLERAGFDQVPTAGNSRNRRDLAGMVEFCRREVSPGRLKGFLMSTWRKMTPDFEAVQNDACELVAEARAICQATGARRPT